MYSSHPTAPLALWARSKELDPAAFNALEQNKHAVRIHAMRNSVFLVPADWAARIVASVPLTSAVKGQRLKYAEISAEDFETVKPKLLARAAEPVNSTDLQPLVPKGANAAVVIHLLCREALLLRLGRGNLRSDDLSYVAAEPWLGHPLVGPGEDNATVWLADQYLRGYGPARVDDFAWWAGLPKGKSKTALADSVDVGSGYLLPADLADDFKAVKPLDAEALDLTPKWDAYTMGYAPDGRERFLNKEHQKLAYTVAGGAATSGDGLPLVLRGGRAVASWGHRLEGKRLVATVRPFPGETAPSETVMTLKLDEVGKLLGVERVSLTFD